MKSQGLSERDRKEDRLSDFPDSVLLHVMKFMDTKYAVQTCVLSKRWKNLWKYLTDLTFHSSNFSSLTLFGNFVSHVLTCRDSSISLRSLDFWRHGCIKHELLYRVMRYAVSHKVKQLTFHANIDVMLDFRLPSYFFSCQSLTFLKFSIRGITRMNARLPKSLELPALKTLHLVNVTFTKSENDRSCADPFSNCNMLNTLIIDHCVLRCGTKVLRISNSGLSSLTILSTLEGAQKIVLSTPNLSSLTIISHPIYQLNACNLPFLEEVNISCPFTNLPNTGLVLISWLQVLANDVKRMTLCLRALEMITVYSTLDSTRTQPPRFGRLKSMKVKMKPYPILSDEGVSKTVAYLLQNSPQPTVDIINCRE